MITGAVYAGASAAFAATDTQTVATELTVEDGEKLFTANCATCHGLDLQGTEAGPSLYGVGELAVEFQVSTGRMPLQMQGPQAPQKEPQFTEEQILAMAAYIQAEAPGPSFPDEEILDGEGDVAAGAELFRVNCAMCHNVSAAGGALTEGKYAPGLNETSALHMYAAMVTGPQNMPVFGDMNLTDEDKRDIISALLFQQQAVPVGGFTLGNLGPVSEGLFVWIFGIGALVAITVWITAKSN
ncbi:Menaquinol-cytochrome c reductase cytochrome c subunit [Microbacterium sp. SA39]|nr:Menaquinol-cytochrome c reductase cytochrome c subunit [Microbacterium sp. SA39]